MPVSIRADSCPSLGDLYRVSLEGERVSVDSQVYRALDRAREAYLGEASKRRIYGFCTGLGEVYDASVECGEGLEEEVLREHAAGVGPRAPEPVVRAFMFARLSQLARGRAPVRGSVARRLEEALNAGIHPVIPLHGSLGASGDLAPSSHAFLCIHLGLGNALYGGREVRCSRALEREGLEPIRLEPGESLALINNTAWTTGIAGLALLAAVMVVEESIEASIESMEVTGCSAEHFDREPAEAKRLAHVSVVAEKVGRAGCDNRRLQDPYSIRCIPVIYGSSLAFLEFSSAVVEQELCASTENPIVGRDGVYHACNFHSAAVGLACDTASIALAHVANSIERRVAHLLNGKTTGLRDYLRWEGSPSGAMLMQYTAAYLAASLRHVAQPATIHSMPTSGLQEDVVPNSPASALKLLRAVSDLVYLVSIERALARMAKTISKGGRPVFPHLSLLIEEEASRVKRRLRLDGLLKEA
ncbi:MAG: aromatic amino acid ammonia-lyase [Desulfurococcales archaeon]|nr:aromatic amino acid ammonia-lyase [Desulfurococcales archaeon]